MLGEHAWPGKLHGELCALIAPVFAQARSRCAAFAYVAALLATAGDRGSGTRPEQGDGRVDGAVPGGVPLGWVAGDEVYGDSSGLRAAWEAAGRGYVPAARANFTVPPPAGPRATAAVLARLVPGAA